MPPFALFHLRKPVNYRAEGDESPFRKAFFTGDVREAIFTGLFDLVVIDEQHDLDALLRATQTNGCRWAARSTGRLFQDAPRCTSVGDIAIELVTGETFSLGMFGWDRVPLDTPGLEALRAEAQTRSHGADTGHDAEVLSPGPT